MVVAQLQREEHEGDGQRERGGELPGGAVRDEDQAAGDHEAQRPHQLVARPKPDDVAEQEEVGDDEEQQHTQASGVGPEERRADGCGDEDRRIEERESNMVGIRGPEGGAFRPREQWHAPT